MTPLLRLQFANAECAKATARVTAAHKAFGRYIARTRRISRSAFARKLGITGAMLALMERGDRRWPMARAKLAVKLLTRREDWPD